MQKMVHYNYYYHFLNMLLTLVDGNRSRRPLGESGACPPPGARPPHHVYRTRVPPGEYYFSEDDAPTIRHHFLRHDTHPGISVFAEVNKTS